jgi:hypothetical protein
VLSAWLLPAITRQWDDRQKAREIKAAMVKEMARASAQSLTDARRMLFLSLSTDELSPQLRALAPEDQWSKASMQIEAQLRAYLPDVAGTWHQYSIQVGNATAAASGTARLPGGTYYDPSRPKALTAVDEDLAAFYEELAIIESFAHKRDVGRAKDKELARDFARIEANLLSDEQFVAEDVLDAHLNGYSTTAGDLLRDLIP